ncbi:MAG: IPT/TIG domain-containing protein, partial [Bacteroidetes bacterium]|nr:IPT/TIG domain-containing protein [Bacteroidota bacterium]
IASISAADAATYTVTVSGICGPPVTSANAVLTIKPPVSIATQPASATSLCPGQAYNLSVTASGTAPYSYQWYKGGTAIGGATSSSFSIASISAADAATYTVMVSGCGPSVTSLNAVLTVNAGTTTTSPVNASVVTGGNASFTVTAAGTPPFTYQWQFDNNTGIWGPLAGQTASSLTISNASNSNKGNYRVVVTGVCGTITSSSALLLVNPPTISNFSPSSGAIGTSVTITGAGFDGTTPSNNTVKFNGVGATVTSSTSTSLTVTVPAAISGNNTINVTVGGQTAVSASSFSVIPTLSGFLPSSGIIGSTVTITGTGFDGTTVSNNTVKFGSTTATVSTATATSLTVTVPAAISGSNTINVTVGGQTATSATPFSVVPTISNFTPSSGAYGTPVTINGTGFDGTPPANNNVKFGSISATVTVSTPTSLIVTVPVGAKSNTISVAVGGQTATSATPFIVPLSFSNFTYPAASAGTALNISISVNYSSAPKFYSYGIAAGAASATAQSPTISGNSLSATIPSITDPIGVAFYFQDTDPATG